MHNFKRITPNPSSKTLIGYVWITLSILIFFIFLAKLPPQRVGDGSEYYALFIAWKETLRPWMTDASYQAYQNLFLQNSITGLVPSDWFGHAFPALTYRGESDFNHFWFYSFLAFAVEKIAHMLGLALSPHNSFLGLHFVFVTTSASVAYYLYGKRGLLTFIIMSLFSPMLWFSDKVHTELMTYCLTLSAVMLVHSKKYIAAAFLLALASTQNPSFALVALIPFTYRFSIERSKKFSAIEVIFSIGTALAVLAHPVYYFLRFGVPTPQLLAGGASLGGNLSIFYIWILDPDLGLLPNWPIGIFLIALAIALTLIKKESISIQGDKKYFILFTAIFFAVNFYANSSTTNLNSGATPGLARYSLWYLPLFFPIVHYVITSIPSRKTISYPITLIIILIGYFSINANNPKKPESYTTPTRLSNAIQTKLPWLYTPPAEVFAERYSGMGETIYHYPVKGVLGPDCHKFLILPGTEKDLITIPHHCQMDAKQLNSLINDFPTPNTETFIKLSDSQYTQSLLKLRPTIYTIGVSGNGNFALASGWYTPESWGAWSSNKVASLSIPCNTAQYYSDRKTLDMSLVLQGFGTQHISISQDKDILTETVLSEKKSIPLTINTNNCYKKNIRIDINIDKPKSPAEIGQSKDTRKLGAGVLSFTLGD